MNDFYNQLQSLDVSNFQTTQMVPWDQNMYTMGTDYRQIGLGVGGCFSCFFCFGCVVRCGGCGGCARCGGCGGCGGRCGRCGHH